MGQCRWDRSWFTAQEAEHDDRTTLHDGSPKQKPADPLGAGRSVVASPAAFARPAARPSPASAVAPPLQPPLHPDRGTEGRLSARVYVPTMERATGACHVRASAPGAQRAETAALFPAGP